MNSVVPVRVGLEVGDDPHDRLGGGSHPHGLAHQRHRASISSQLRAQLPRVRVSREFLDDFFAKFNIDGTQESNKASVAEKLRHTLGTPKLEGMVEAVAEAVLSHVEANGDDLQLEAKIKSRQCQQVPRLRMEVRALHFDA